MSRFRRGEAEARMRGAVRRFILSGAFSLVLVPPTVFAAAVEVICVGDVMMAHGMKTALAEKGSDYPFEKVRGLLKNGDFVFGNLENPIGAGGERYPDKDFHFLMDPRDAAALKRAGFRALSLANNHVMDFGPEVLRETLTRLKDQGIASCGAGTSLAEAREPAVVKVRGRRVAFLAYSRSFPISFTAETGKSGTVFALESLIREDVERARRDHDWVIVSFHWGEEYIPRPVRPQRLLAYLAIDAGADAVIGHHPHVAQGFEVYKGKIIAYSLGNFVFGTRNPRVVDGLVLKLRLSTDGPPSAEIVPVLAQNNRTAYQTVPLRGASFQKSFERLKILSAELGTPLRLEKGRILLP